MNKEMRFDASPIVSKRFASGKGFPYHKDGIKKVIAIATSTMSDATEACGRDAIKVTRAGEMSMVLNNDSCTGFFTAEDMPASSVTLFFTKSGDNDYSLTNIQATA